MREQLEKLVEELSLLVAMLHEADQVGMQMTLESCQTLANLIKNEKDYEPLLKGALYVLELGKGEDLTDLFYALQDFATAAQAFLRDPTGANFPGSAAASSSPSSSETGWGDDLAPDYDAELTVEFINKHTTLLDEFESELLLAVGNSDPKSMPGTDGKSEIDRQVKAYLHNVKGEAGTVGLKGVALVTHRLEDLVVELGAAALIDQLIAYKEWLLVVCRACSSGKAPPVLAAEFLKGLEASITANTNTPQKAMPQKGKKSSRSKKTAASSPPSSEQGAHEYAITGELEVLGEFIAEAEDHLNSVEEALLERRGACDTEDVAAFFRAIHSVKGGSAYFGLKEMTESSHLTETLLDEVRNDRVPFTAQLAELLLSYLDLQKDLFAEARACIKSGGKIKPSPKTNVYLERLKREYAAVFTNEKGGIKKSPSDTAPPSASAKTAEEAQVIPDTPPAQAGHPIPSAKGAVTGEKLDVKTFLKVEAGRLDQLIDYVGELVISASMLTQNCKTYLGDNETVMKNSHQLEQILREVQYIAMSMRLVPVKGVFQKMARLVWDLGRKIGKSVNFKMEGEDTELDRTVIDKIADPLMHMVRNSLDHGLEPPYERESLGKPREGTIILRAFHKAGTVHIQIIDDGRGLDHEKIRQKAIEKGIISEEQSLSKQDLWSLIFAPGFSTATVVTDVSGRGVGMDVVRRNIESMRGRVLIDSEVGKGTTFTIELPLTLAIMDGIETSLGLERFIIPTLSIVEFIKPTPAMLSSALDRSEVLEFRGKYLPIFRLSRLFQVEPKYSNPSDAIVVVVEGGGEQVAIMVDDVIGKHSTVIKSLGTMFQDIKGLAGCAIMPDGYVGLILDIQSLVALARSPEAALRPATLPPVQERLETVH